MPVGLANFIRRGSTGKLDVALIVFGAAGIGKHIRVVLVHHVDRYVQHVGLDPVQDRHRAALDMIRHHQMTDGHILAPVFDGLEIFRHGFPIPRRAREFDRTTPGAEFEIRQTHVDEDA